MAVRHVKEYYNKVCDQYHDMLNEIRDFEEEAKKGLIEPERLDEIKKNIQPLINNYQTLSYIIFLLNQPNRQSKEKAYQRRNKEFLSKIKKENTQEGLLDKGQDVLEKLNKIIK